MIPTDLPFQFKRLQFPMKVCFIVVTINKANQGQSFKAGPFHLNSPKACQGQVTDSFNKNIYFCTVQNREGVFQHFAQKNFPNDIWIIKKKTPHVSELARLSLHAP